MLHLLLLGLWCALLLILMLMGRHVAGTDEAGGDTVKTLLERSHLYPPICHIKKYFALVPKDPFQ